MNMSSILEMYFGEELEWNFFHAPEIKATQLFVYYYDDGDLIIGEMGENHGLSYWDNCGMLDHFTTNQSTFILAALNMHDEHASTLLPFDLVHDTPVCQTYLGLI